MGPIQFNFKHQNIRDTYAALHVANTVLRLSATEDHDEKFGCEIDLHADLNDFTEEISNSIKVLCENDRRLMEKSLNSSQNLIVLQVKIKQSRKDEEAREYASRFVHEYEYNLNDDSPLKTALAEMYILALCILAKNYRLIKYPDISPLDSFKECLEYASTAKDVYERNNDFNSDGYNHIGKCLNSFMEYVLNSKDDILEDCEYPLIKKAFEDIGFATTVLFDLHQHNDNINSGFALILKAANDAYCSYSAKRTKDEKVLWILALHFVSRAYMVEACKRNSAESLNLMAMILENDYNIRLREKINEKYREDIEQFKSFGENRLDLCFSFYHSASQQPHVVRGYSALKKASMLIKYDVSLFRNSNEAKFDEITSDLNYAERSNRSMTYYWKGRFSNDLLNDSQNAKKYFEFEQRKQLENDNSSLENLSPQVPLMLTKIELLRFYNISNEEKDTMTDILDLIKSLSYDTLSEDYENMICRNSSLCNEICYIVKCLFWQKSNVNKNLSADKFWVTKETVEENIERFKENLCFLFNKTEVSTYE